jgi:CHAT domain-containing protein
MYRYKSVRFIWLLPVIMACGSLYLSNCSPNSSGECEKYASDASAKLGPEVWRILNSDDTEFNQYANSCGYYMLYNIQRALYGLIDLESEVSYIESIECIFPHMKRVCQALREYHDCGEFLDSVTYFEEKEPGEGLQLMQDWALVDGAMKSNITRQEKLEILDHYTPVFVEADYTKWVAVNELSYYEILNVLGAEEASMNHLFRCIRICRENGFYERLCQSQGVVGVYHEQRGHVDSMMTYWQDVSRIALDHGIANQAARMHSFNACYQQANGRLAKAAEQFAEAQRVCVALKGGLSEARYIIDELEFLSNYGFWDKFSERLRRTKTVLREMLISDQGMPSQKISHQIDLLDARFRMVNGETDLADSIYSSLAESGKNILFGAEYAELLLSHSDGLLLNNRPEAALAILDSARGVCESSQKFSILVNYRIQTARALNALDRHHEALAELLSLHDKIDEINAQERAINGSAMTEYYGCLAWTHLDLGDREAARNSIEASLHYLGGVLHNTSASVAGYLFFNGCTVTHAAAHRYLSEYPGNSYWFEMDWRSLNRCFGKNHAGNCIASNRLKDHLDTDTISSGLLHFLSEKGDLFGKNNHRDAVHLLYSRCGDDVVRWKASKQGIYRESIEVDFELLAAQVFNAANLMRTRPEASGSKVPAHLTASLAELARILLPEEILIESGDHTISPLLITPVECLSRLSFEALNLGTSETYLPALSLYDVAYVRYMDPKPTSPAAGKGVALADPDIPVHLKRRFPTLREHVQGTVELKAIQNRWPHIVSLTGKEATKAKLISSIDDAPWIYIAAHFVRDPQISQLSVLPLAGETGDDSFRLSPLGISDIHSANLGNCELVVLSGCGTGQTCHGTKNMIPGLGDTFVDAGVSAVIHTIWDVLDDDAIATMSRFIEYWTGEDNLPATAICRARRDVYKSEGEYRHPFHWAAYTIKLGEFE